VTHCAARATSALGTTRQKNRHVHLNAGARHPFNGCAGMSRVSFLRGTRMKKPAIVIGTSAFVFLVMACGGISNEEACNKVKSACSASSTGDAGGVSVTVSCEPDNFDKMSNDSDVKDCIDKASDCNGMIACMAKAKE
jgi:hypothetical protein